MSSSSIENDGNILPTEWNCDSSSSNNFLLEILQDLEIERRRRIELEATVRHLSKQQNSSTNAPNENNTMGRIQCEAPNTTAAKKDFIEEGNEDIVSESPETLNSETIRLSEALLESSLKRRAEESDNSEATMKQLLTLKAERDGLMQMIDAIFDKNNQSDALSVAHAALGEGKPSIPLHVLHMLETTPWDPRARRHTSCVEEVYEWQYYSRRHGWTNEIKEFPNCFLKGVPRRRPAPTPIEIQNNSRHGLPNNGDLNGVDTGSAYQKKKKIGSNKESLLSCDTAQPPPLLQQDSGKGEQRSRISLSFNSGCVLTNHDCNVRYNLEDGFPMPNQGTWNWVGGWRVDSSECTLDSDENGWSYSNDVEHLALRKQTRCYDSPLPETEEEHEEWEKLIDCNPKHTMAHGIIRPFRLRRWTRLRVLTSYPCIGEMSKQFLTLSAQNAGLAVSISKVSNQLLNAQINLAEKEEKIACSRELQTQLEMAQNSLQEKDDQLKDLQQKLCTSEKRARDAEKKLTFSAQNLSKDSRPFEEVPHQSNISRRLFKSASEKISTSTPYGTIARAESPTSPLSFLPKIVSNASANFVSRLPKVGGDSNGGVRALIMVDEDDQQEGSRGIEVDTVCCDSGADEESLVPDSLSLGSSDESRLSQHTCSDNQSSRRDSEEVGDLKDTCFLTESREAVSFESSSLGDGSTTIEDDGIVKSFTESIILSKPELTPHKNFSALPFMPFRCKVTDDGATVAVTPTCDGR